MNQATSQQAGREENYPFRYIDVITAVFVTVLVVSNIASSAKIIDLGFDFFGRTDLRAAFDAGTLLFPVSYIFGDILTEVYGYRRSRRVIWLGFGCLMLTALVFALVRVLPGEAQWQGYAGQSAYVAILGGISSGGIVLASLAGYWGGEFANSFVLAKMKIATRGRRLWARTIGSTLVGQVVDTVAFFVVACLFGVFPWSLFLVLVLTNYLFKCAVEAVMTPVTYLAVDGLKRAEGVDVYDIGTDFNPFQV
ncbi:MAG: queuosine precursor transporter [Chloroflexota bacterium]